MTQNAHVLICGRDFNLLSTRGLVLKAAGYNVSETMGSLELSPDLETVRLLIVCHTLSEGERQMALAALERRAPKAKALCLVPNHGGGTHCSATVDSFAGPYRMLHAVQQLLVA